MNNTTLHQVQHLHIADYNYTLPDERIAKHPLANREACKLLVSSAHGISSHIFSEVPALLPANALLIYNNTRVIHARLRWQKATGSNIEIFCLEPVSPVDYQLNFQAVGSCTWLCLVGNSKRWKQGLLTQQLSVDGNTVTITAERGVQRKSGWEITFRWDADVTFASILTALGEIPIPPYLNRHTEASDETDYQTVYSHIDGSVAAPTAGLHFTDHILAECDRRGIQRRELTLHVGAGTFQPVKSDDIGDHNMHYEYIEVTRTLIAELAATERPVIAVGTTSVRTLESLYYVGQILEANPDAAPEELTVTQWMPYDTPCVISTRRALQNITDYLERNNLESLTTQTQLMIAPSFRYRIVKGIITNFHQPQSTLLLLVAAFVGNDNWRRIYDYALDNDYRFLSYGDACLFLR